MSCNNCSNKNCALSEELDRYNHEHHYDGHEHEHEHYHHHDHDHECADPGCGCHHHHHGADDDGSMKKRFIRICAATGLFIIVFVLDKIFELASVNPGPSNWVLPFVCYFIVYMILGFDIIKEAFHGITHGELLDENFLMAVASLGAFALGIYKGCIGQEPDGFEEGCAVVIFYSIGEFFQDWALGRSRRSIAELMNIRPDLAHKEDGTVLKPEEVSVGEVIVIKKGEKVPLDGILLSDEALIDSMAISGESEYESILKDGEILSGTINMGEDIRVRVTKEFHDSTVARILDLVENAADKKAKTETFITRFARIYTPVVVGLAAAIAIIPPVIGLITGSGIDVSYVNSESSIFTGPLDLTWTTWVYRALSFLVVSCPCALVISIPLSFFMGIGTASRYHILIKGSNCLELVSKANVFVSDKTGTLTVGRDVKPEAKSMADWIKKKGGRLYILSGDKKQVVENLAGQLGVSDYAYELKPQEKVQRLEDIMSKKALNDVVIYMGDGINDAPSLIRADVGIAMGNIGSDAAVEASNIVLMKDNLNSLPILKKIAYRTMMIVHENIIFTIGIKIAVLILSAFGITNMWVAVFADVGVALLAVLNALRVGAVKYKAD